MIESLSNFSFSEENKLIAVNILKKYPVDRKNSAVMPLLDIAQRQNDGWLSRDTIEYVAEYLGMPIIKVMEDVPFYTMYHTEKIGKYMILFCINISCQLNGCDKLLEHTAKKLNIKVGETTSDKKFTLHREECLAACTEAPMMRVNDTYYGNLTEQRIDQIIDSLD